MPLAYQPWLQPLQDLREAGRYNGLLARHERLGRKEEAIFAARQQLDGGPAYPQAREDFVPSLGEVR